MSFQLSSPYGGLFVYPIEHMLACAYLVFAFKSEWGLNFKGLVWASQRLVDYLTKTKESYSSKSNKMNKRQAGFAFEKKKNLYPT